MRSGSLRKREAKFKQHVEDRKLKIIKKFWHDSLVCRAQPERLRKRGLQMNSFLLLFDQADLLDLELTKLETKQSFIDSQDDTENSDQRLCDFEEFVL